MLVWEAVFGAWVGWSERDKGLLRTMLDVQRRYVELLTHGVWTPLAAASEGLEVVASRWTLGDSMLWTLVNRTAVGFSGAVELDGVAVDLELPARGVAAREPDGRLVVSPGGSDGVPELRARRVEPASRPGADVPA